MNARGMWLILALMVLAAAVLTMAGCGGTVGINTGGGGGINCGGCGSNGGSGGTGGGVGTGTNAPMTVTLLDPPTCASPRGTLSHLYLTVTDVQVNPDAAATADSTGWIDVTPNLSTTPKQIDLFNFSTTLGNLATGTAPAGTYGSVRLFLASNSSSVTGNQCGGNGVNCAISGAATLPVFVATETTRGVVINSSSMPGGAGIVVGSTGTNLNILFNSCASLMSYQGGFRLLPKATAWAGTIQVYQITLSDSATAGRIGTGDAIVAMEQAGTSGADEIFTEGSPDGTGLLTLFGPAGTFDFVAVARGTAGASQTMYSPLIVTGVAGSGGSTTSFNMNMVSQGVVSPGTIVQPIDSGAAAIDVRVSVRQQATINSVPTQLFTIPILNGLSSAFVGTTALSTGCGGTNCVQASMDVPAQQVYVQSGIAGTPVLSTGAMTYDIKAEAFRSQFAAFPDCTTSVLTGTTTAPVPGQTITPAQLTFSGCQ